MKKIAVLIILCGCFIPAKAQTKSKTIGKRDSLALVKLSKDLIRYDSSLNAYIELMNVLLTQGEEALDTFNPEEKECFRKIIKITDGIINTYSKGPDPAEIGRYLKVLNGIVDRGQSHKVYIAELATQCTLKIIAISELGMSSEEEISKKVVKYSRVLDKTLRKYNSKYIATPEEKKLIEQFLKTVD